jgi:Zn-finger nucleic acid-binding protein
MKCPSCITTDLVKAHREGINVDYCPSCNGMWLDRGELDKVVSRINGEDPSYQENKITGNGKITSDQANHHSPIMDGIENSRELHQLHMNQGKHHWMHRLFK